MAVDRQRKTRAPCKRCRLNEILCICQEIPRLELSTRVVLIIHAKELKRTTNSGTLALHALPNSEMRIRGADKIPVNFSDLVEGDYDSLLYFPTDEAVELTEEFIETRSRPIQLIVPDGNWRQASKVAIRHPELAGIPRVMLTRQNTAEHHLRAESSSYGMSTLEAIARALGVIEGAAVEAEMLKLYDAKLRATAQRPAVKK